MQTAAKEWAVGNCTLLLLYQLASSWYDDSCGVSTIFALSTVFRLHLLLQWLTNKPNVCSVTYNGLAMKLLLLKRSTQLQILNKFKRNINSSQS